MGEKLRKLPARLSFTRRNWTIAEAEEKEREFINGIQYPIEEKILILPDSAHETSIATPEDIKKRLALQARRLLQSKDPASVRYRRKNIVKIIKWLTSA